VLLKPLITFYDIHGRKGEVLFFIFFILLFTSECCGARWPRVQCTRRAIAEAKQRSQRSVILWVTKIYYLELLRASEGTLNHWSRLHLQSLAPTVVKIITESYSQHDETPTHLVSECNLL
jgi:hypothetical protein